MSRALSFQEFLDVLRYVDVQNSMIGRSDPKKPMVKYIDPTFDMRTRTVFCIKFRGYGEHVLHCVNECRDLPESLFERCMSYLKGEDVESVPAARGVPPS